MEGSSVVSLRVFGLGNCGRVGLFCFMGEGIFLVMVEELNFSVWEETAAELDVTPPADGGIVARRDDIMDHSH